jgi:hypothetical protein
MVGKSGARTGGGDADIAAGFMRALLEPSVPC